MIIINFIIAIVALVIAILALKRTGGIPDLRESTASMLAKMEQVVRKEETGEGETEETKKQK